MDGTEIKLGTKLELTLNEADVFPDGLTCISQLLEIMDEKNIIIANPIYESRHLFVPKKTKVNAVFSVHMQGLFTFEGEIIGRTKDINVAALALNIKGDITKVQRRSFYRLEHILFLDYRIIGKTELKHSATRNLSGGGLCLSSYEPIEPGEDLELFINLNGDYSFKAIASVIFCLPIDLPKIKKYEVGLKYTKMNPKDQEALIKYIYEKQRSIMKR